MPGFWVNRHRRSPTEARVRGASRVSRRPEPLGSPEQALATALAGLPESDRLLVGYSGGLDSTVLLHALLAWNREQGRELLAVHVHHGISSAADDWSRHCQSAAGAMGAPLVVKEVRVAASGSPEEAAREARYRAFASLSGKSDVLLLAHHRQDQAETFLLRALRGAGLQGLGGMPAQRTLGNARLLRPFLKLDRKCLLDYAQRQGLSWTEDPSNWDPALGRGLLRKRVFPQLSSHWPNAASCFARAAGHAREAAELLAELGEADIKDIQVGERALSQERARRLSAARRRNLLRVWLVHWAFRSPPEALLHEIDGQIQEAESFCFHLAEGDLRGSGGRIFLLRGRAPAPLSPGVWNPAAGMLDLGYASLRADFVNGDALLRIPSQGFRVQARCGGEKLRLGGRSRTLKELLRERRVPPWARGLLPVLFSEGEIVAVADLAVADGWQTKKGEPGWSLCWQPHNDHAWLY